MKKFSSLLVVLLLMLASFTAGVEYQRGDVNQDGAVNITDVTCLIDYLLTGSWPEEPVTPQTETFTVNGVTFTMVGVQGGTFTMGATDEQGSDASENEYPAHEVTLSSFSIGQTEVTQELWVAVMGSNPSEITGNLQCPVDHLYWDDCQTFIEKLNQLTGRNFRLPTEAEWEYAARGGNKSQGYKYAGSNDVNEVAWHSGNSDASSHPVATKIPNELGLYDMSGNILEWCQDGYGSYSSTAQIDPVGPITGSERICRGGSWYGTFQSCRVSKRDYGWVTTTCCSFVGMRLVL